MYRGYWKQIFRVIVLLLGLWLSFDLAAHLTAEILWFQEVGYLSTFLVRVKTQLGLWAIALASLGFLLGNLSLAQRLGHLKPLTDDADIPKGMPLLWLLPIVLGLSLLIGLILLYFSQIAVSYWHPNLSVATFAPQPISFEMVSIWQGGLTILLIVYPQFLLRAITLFISLCFGLVLSTHWTRVWLYFHPTTFNDTEPLFGKDISFYVFDLPFWELLEFWLFGLFLYSLISVTLSYLLSGNSLSQGSFPGFSQKQQRHLYGLGGCLFSAIALSYWLKRYELLYSTRGVTYGASYTDAIVQLPIYTILSIVAGAIAVFLLWQTTFWFPTKNEKGNRTIKILPFLSFFCLLTFSFLLPEVIQRLVVQPNELAREKPYIERSISLTRHAFDLEEVEVKTFAPEGKLTVTDLQKNDLTIRNIRLWDTRPLLQSNRQLQQIRPYYKFPNADIDRYTFLEGKRKEEEENRQTEKRQVILAARELDYSAVPQQAKTWVNEHLVYTHGYGFTLSPVNTVGAGGLPDYFVKDIGGADNDGTLQTASDRIRASIPIGYPRIYYGEIADTYVMTGTKVKELDYPSGNANADNIYDGRGGVAIGSWWRRLVFAQYLKDWQTVLTRNFTPQTKLLFRRNIKERVKAIAPFLRYDSDPYLVVADAKQGAGDNYLYWIIDAYTASDRYPYSDPGKNEFNYIRNSVKVVIDAYNGSVDFYIADPQDAIVTTLAAIFPELFKPLDALPVALRNHLRYPVDLFNIQSERLLSYHMTDPQVFYNREDQWQVPTEIYAGKPQSVEPYYLIMKLPTAPTEEFVLLLPFTPTQRTNLIAWLAARSDGKEYGKLLLYEFPKQQLVYGTEQIEALINQDPVISQQISLWNRQGSRAIQGNLLVIPIEKSLLYVEPLYLEAEQNSLPTLARVIVAYENRIVMAQTLEQALKAVFQPENPAAPPIVRPVAG